MKTVWNRKIITLLNQVHSNFGYELWIPTWILDIYRNSLYIPSVLWIIFANNRKIVFYKPTIFVKINGQPRNQSTRMRDHLWLLRRHFYYHNKGLNKNSAYSDKFRGRLEWIRIQWIIKIVLVVWFFDCNSPFKENKKGKYFYITNLITLFTWIHENTCQTIQTTELDVEYRKNMTTDLNNRIKSSTEFE